MVKKEAWKITVYLIKLKRIFDKKRTDLAKENELANWAYLYELERRIHVIDQTLKNMRKLGLIHQRQYFSKYTYKTTERLRKQKEALENGQC